MIHLEETALAGVGVRYDFDSHHGQRVGVVVHRDGQRELFVSEPDDPDACGLNITLNEEEAKAVSDLMGGSTVTRRIGQAMQDIEGLTIEWIHLPEASEFLNQSIGQMALRTRTGATIVAIFRAEQAIPAPEPSFVVQAADTLVVVGTPEGLQQTYALLVGEA